MRAWQGREVGVGNGAGSLGRDRSRNKGLLEITCLVLLGSASVGTPQRLGTRMRPKAKL